MRQVLTCTQFQHFYVYIFASALENVYIFCELNNKTDYFYKKNPENYMNEIVIDFH